MSIISIVILSLSSYCHFMIKSNVSHLFIGQPRPFRGETYSSMSREESHASILLTKMGLEGDACADTESHGGLDKALHIYPFEHYDLWRSLIGDHPMLDKGCAFGENITANGMTEDKIKVGDQFIIGEAIIECSHGRQPCWKIEHNFGLKNMVSSIIKHGHCGLYFRVLKEGTIKQGDVIEQVHSPEHDWTVSRIFSLLFGGRHKEFPEQLDQLIALEPLAEAWKRRVKSLTN